MVRGCRMANKLLLHIEGLPVLNYSLVHNHVPLINDIKVENLSDELIENIRIKIHFTNEIIKPFESNLFSIEVKDSFHISHIKLK